MMAATGGHVDGDSLGVAETYRSLNKGSREPGIRESLSGSEASFFRDSGC